MKVNKSRLLEALKSPSSLRSLRFGDRSAQLSAEQLTPTESKLADWLGKLKLLHGIPFNYLVPYVEMLPAESIRFFYCDTTWLNYLVEGAMSLGRSTSVYQAHDQTFLSDLHALSLLGLKSQRKQVLGHLVNYLSGKERTQLNTEPIDPNEKVTGFLLRSGVVSGWPGLQVAAFSDVDQTTPCTLLRMDHLSPNVLFCMYEGVVRSIRINEHTEALHFGVDISPNPPHTYSKSFRYVVDVDGHKAGKQVDEKVAPPLQMAVFERGNQTRVIRMNDLAKAMQLELNETIGYTGAFTAAEFALEMVEGVEAVNFNINPPEKP